MVTFIRMPIRQEVMRPHPLEPYPLQYAPTVDVVDFGNVLVAVLLIAVMVLTLASAVISLVALHRQARRG